MNRRSTNARSTTFGLFATILAGCFAIPALGADLPSPGAKAPLIRELTSKHLTLFTDLPSSPEVDGLPTLFDQAFGQWCAYFGVDEKQHDAWQVQGYLMKIRERFAAAGMLPDDLPNFPNGYARGDKLWLYDQTSAYYRRHLLLHEGTHAFMSSLASGRGPSWFSEAMAELLATHRLEDGRLTLNCFPRSRDEVPKWGRIEIVQAGYAARNALSLAKIFADNRPSLENEMYGWCWAVAAFLDGHPRYRARFRQLHKLAGQRDFSEQLAKLFADEWTRLNEDWQLFVANLDYGYDFQKTQVDFVPGKPIGPEGASVVVAADRGWQSSGVQLQAGQKYRLRATGRYQVAGPKPIWWCEPGGITIRYEHGQPLGILLAAIRADEANPAAASGLLKPVVVGLETTLKAQRDGTLYLRINDSSGSLADNQGSLSVEITHQ